jgi:hypothetical protein
MATTRFPDAPSRVARLPVDRRGFPVPWFVAWLDGQPQFPVVDAAKLAVAWKDERCWVCGDRLGAYRGWVVGPMSVIEGATPEPPSHYECAGFAVRTCPFLANTNPRWSGKAVDAPGFAPQANVSGVLSDATAIWLSKGRGATPFQAGDGLLFGLDEPARLEWYVAGRSATGAEVREAIAAGLPTLRRSAEAQGRAAAFEQRLRWVESWIPAD